MADTYDPVLYQTPIYRVWSNMKTRCQNQQTPDYLRYGARGITICPEWESFGRFYTDMGKSYLVGLTLDRKDNNAEYNKNNCHWVNRKVQANNRRTNRILSLNGVTKTVAEWANDLGINSTTIRQRLDAYGWSVEKTLTTGV